MHAGEIEIRFPTIMNKPVLEFWQNVKIIQCFLTAFFVNAVPGPGFCGEKM